ncbi:DNA polymerase III subunit gamma/tau [Jannaschia seohaensis]|uniref:DNA polymerase III subunit gamma/tau n=1 Tax=Jannaschia seohaensis TaxID=475081 RepID=A0A2Y9B5A7_9RHOB|nr:DNA polymerase III subunit gamma/tau [Jannaschia seohaensis]PWJ12092.1 DNA polymerase-3 subunit gamma/tau [Jannaschia seohaensis]SSA51195.1 DNA polymerase-3 subunit gamma/tau [Jannaschia seohaensis]
MQDQPADQAYQVLARKYRPATFADLIGQDPMVRTLRNAFAQGRIAQAFILTGIRGTGKTTTARIVAKGLNCVGPDGAGGPTTDPCGQCEPCRAIAEGRHVDVLEMDAASNTGVGDMREIIDSVHYRAASARYKIYIIDEVHMLSNSAFNALLKTLEEPPAHVKFIFATTEIRKVPVTVLSRCQRFDLRRIEPEVMIAHLRGVAEKEGAEIAEDALGLIARAAEGSVRDAMSLLDQAISHGAGETTADQVRAMLGLADRGRVLDLFELIMKGEAAAALMELGAQYSDGADPMAVLRDLADVTHWVSVIQITPDAAEDPTVGPDERARGQAMAQGLPMRSLTRMWQMLLKALEEVSQAPNPMMAAEMAVIRLTHVADLPSPDELIRKLRDAPAPAAQAPTAPRPAPSGGGGGTPALRGGAAPALAADQEQALARFQTFPQVVELIRANRDVKLLVEVETGVRLIRYAPGRIEMELAPDAAGDLPQRLAGRLQGWTGVRWVITLGRGGAPTIAETRDAARRETETAALAHPLTQAVLAAFPGAQLLEVRTRAEIEQAAAGEALEEVEDEWDPFDED